MKTLNEVSDVNRKDNILIPKYDKSLRHGRGDRADPRQWTVIKPTATPIEHDSTGSPIEGGSAVDIVLLEGWMLGFEPIKSFKTKEMIEINEFLKGYKVVHDMMDMWIVLAVESTADTSSSSSFSGNKEEKEEEEEEAISQDTTTAGAAMESLVFKWRMQAEDSMRSQGKSAMTTEQV